MSLTGKDIAEIARLLDSSHFTSLDLTMGEFRLKLRRGGGGGARGWSDEPREDVPATPSPPSTTPLAADQPSVAAQAGDLVAYADALGAIGKGCGECHGKYRGK